MSIDTILLILAIAVSLVGILIYYVYTRMLRPLVAMFADPFETLFTDENIEFVLEKVVNNEKYQKFLIVSGGLVANGAKSGFGLSKGTGKRGLEGIVYELLGGFVKQKFGVGSGGGGESPTQPLNTSNTSLT